MLLTVGAIAWPALADDISDAISDGQQSYEAGVLAGAKQSLDTALQLIAQQNAEG